MEGKKSDVSALIKDATLLKNYFQNIFRMHTGNDELLDHIHNYLKPNEVWSTINTVLWNTQPTDSPNCFCLNVSQLLDLQDSILHVPNTKWSVLPQIHQKFLQQAWKVYGKKYLTEYKTFLLRASDSDSDSSDDDLPLEKQLQEAASVKLARQLQKEEETIRKQEAASVKLAKQLQEQEEKKRKRQQEKKRREMEALQRRQERTKEQFEQNR